MKENNPKEDGSTTYWKTLRGKSRKGIEKQRV
jgi:hypothetical protein